MKIPRAEEKKARIEIIPMIDAIFFLLVFFMMTSLQMVHLGHKVDLPGSQTAETKFNDHDKVVVTVDKEGKYYLDRDTVTAPQIVPRLTALLKTKPELTVIINCDRTQQVSHFVRVFDLIKQANPANVMIATTPKSPGELGS